jgi:hypothetical protein
VAIAPVRPIDRSGAGGPTAAAVATATNASASANAHRTNQLWAGIDSIFVQN